MSNTESKSLLEKTSYDYLLAVAFLLQKDLIAKKFELEKVNSDMQRIEDFLSELEAIPNSTAAFEFLSKRKDIPYNYCTIKGPDGKSLNNPLERS